MFNRTAEKTAANIVFVGAPLTSLFIVLSSVTDPVNATKLAVAGGLGFALFFVYMLFAGKPNFIQFKYFLISSFLFFLAMVNATLASESPVQQNLYGAFGRNTGLVAYLVLSMAAIGTLLLRDKMSFSKIIWGLQFTGFVNVVYCLWVILFGDFLSWNNPYGNILGLFGNPNFISAFLGMFITTLIAFAASKNSSWKYRITAVSVGSLAFYEIVDSNSIQGIVVTAGGIAIVGFFVVRSYLRNSLFTWIYLLVTGVVGVVAILGALQKGPLSFVYKTSVSLRGEYWRAGLAMGMDNPFNGVGMDSYGDWFRRTRSLNAATVLPGPKTITNASHNVVIDFFAYGGWPLLLSYLAMLVLTAIAIVRVIVRSKHYEPLFIAMAAAWTCYQVQSLISINQIGLAIWGWILTGALIAYEFATRSSTDDTEKTKASSVKPKQNSSPGLISPQLVGGIAALVGLLIAVPPMSADTNWRSALNSRDSNKVNQALIPGYLNPPDSARLAQGVQLFANSNLPDQAHALALKGVEFNPQYFDAWRLLYFIPSSTPQEKAEALKKMKMLDPLNPEVLAN
jgi:hypothetical protein